MSGWLTWCAGLLAPGRQRPKFPLLSLPLELIVIVLSHLVNLEFEYFRNTLIALPELKELVICLTNCPEAASGILGSGVQCVREHEYERIMSSPFTKKPLSIMIVSPYVPHRGEQLRSFSWMGFPLLLDLLHSHIHDTVVRIFITLDERTHFHQALLASLQDLLLDKVGLGIFTRLEKFPSRCSCPQPMSFIQREIEIPSSNGYILRPQSNYHMQHKDAEGLWLGRGHCFPYSFLSACEYFPRLKRLSLDFKYMGPQEPANCSFTGSRLRFRAPLLQKLTINFWTIQCPIINDLAIENEKPPYRECSGKELVVHNMVWSPSDARGWKRGCRKHEFYHDHFHCCTASFSEPGVKLSFMFESYVLIGVPDTFLVHARWECVKSLFWRRLEPTAARHDVNPIVLSCPSLKHLKIFHTPSDKVPLIKFDVPVLEQLVLVSIPGSAQPWDVLNLLNHRWPRTLQKLTIAPHPLVGCPWEMLFPGRIIPPEPLLTHLWIQRVELTPHVKDIIFRHLVYLDLDVTAIPVTRTGISKYSIIIILNHSQYPVLNTLILSMPLFSNRDHTIDAPVSVSVPETCQCIGVATMLAMRHISVNKHVLQNPPNFIQRPHLEIFTRYTKEDERFVADGQMMAGNGDSLDILIHTQRSNFDHEKTHCV